MEAVAGFLPCSRTLFYKSNPEIQALADHIQAHAPVDQERPTLTPEAQGAALLAEADLEAEITRVVSRAVWAMQKFVNQHRDSDDGPEGASLAA